MVKEYATQTSTISVESGIFDMEMPSLKEEMQKMSIGEIVEKILIDANKEGRLISGLNNAAKYFNETETPEDSLFFFMAPARDSTTHMSTILLKAFCFENDIYCVQLDNADKLSKIINCEGVTCALVQRSIVNKREDEKCSVTEEILIDTCEDFWDEIVQPVIKLPEK